eukprot:m.103681 g.103681  ORF g.103681 m.103681 type:complete len:1669 (-) comp9099_c0_seq1:677-5683(-)
MWPTTKINNGLGSLDLCSEFISSNRTFIAICASSDTEDVITLLSLAHQLIGENPNLVGQHQQELLTLLSNVLQKATGAESDAVASFYGMVLEVSKSMCPLLFNAITNLVFTVANEQSDSQPSFQTLVPHALHLSPENITLFIHTALKTEMKFLKPMAEIVVQWVTLSITHPYRRFAFQCFRNAAEESKKLAIACVNFFCVAFAFEKAEVSRKMEEREQRYRYRSSFNSNVQRGSLSHSPATMLDLRLGREIVGMLPFLSDIVPQHCGCLLSCLLCGGCTCESSQVILSEFFHPHSFEDASVQQEKEKQKQKENGQQQQQRKSAFSNKYMWKLSINDMETATWAAIASIRKATPLHHDIYDGCITNLYTLSLQTKTYIGNPADFENFFAKKSLVENCLVLPHINRQSSFENYQPASHSQRFQLLTTMVKSSPMQTWKIYNVHVSPLREKYGLRPSDIVAVMDFFGETMTSSTLCFVSDWMKMFLHAFLSKWTIYFESCCENSPNPEVLKNQKQDVDFLSIFLRKCEDLLGAAMKFAPSIDPLHADHACSILIELIAFARGVLKQAIKCDSATFDNDSPTHALALVKPIFRFLSMARWTKQFRVFFTQDLSADVLDETFSDSFDEEVVKTVKTDESVQHILEASTSSTSKRQNRDRRYSVGENVSSTGMKRRSSMSNTQYRRQRLVSVTHPDAQKSTIFMACFKTKGNGMTFMLTQQFQRYILLLIKSLNKALPIATTKWIVATLYNCTSCWRFQDLLGKEDVELAIFNTIECSRRLSKDFSKTTSLANPRVEVQVPMSPSMDRRKTISSPTSPSTSTSSLARMSKPSPLSPGQKLLLARQKVAAQFKQSSSSTSPTKPQLYPAKVGPSAPSYIAAAHRAVMLDLHLFLGSMLNLRGASSQIIKLMCKTVLIQNPHWSFATFSALQHSYCHDMAPLMAEVLISAPSPSTSRRYLSFLELLLSLRKAKKTLEYIEKRNFDKSSLGRSIVFQRVVTCSFLVQSVMVKLGEIDDLASVNLPFLRSLATRTFSRYFLSLPIAERAKIKPFLFQFIQQQFTKSNYGKSTLMEQAEYETQAAILADLVENYTNYSVGKFAAQELATMPFPTASYSQYTMNNSTSVWFCNRTKVVQFQVNEYGRCQIKIFSATMSRLIRLNLRDTMEAFAIETAPNKLYCSECSIMGKHLKPGLVSTHYSFTTCDPDCRFRWLYNLISEDLEKLEDVIDSAKLPDPLVNFTDKSISSVVDEGDFRGHSFSFQKRRRLVKFQKQEKELEKRIEQRKVEDDLKLSLNLSLFGKKKPQLQSNQSSFDDSNDGTKMEGTDDVCINTSESNEHNTLLTCSSTTTATAIVKSSPLAKESISSTSHKVVMLSDCPKFISSRGSALGLATDDEQKLMLVRLKIEQLEKELHGANENGESSSLPGSQSISTVDKNSTGKPGETYEKIILPQNEVEFLIYHYARTIFPSMVRIPEKFALDCDDLEEVTFFENTYMVGVMYEGGDSSYDSNISNSCRYDAFLESLGEKIYVQQHNNFHTGWIRMWQEMLFQINFYVTTEMNELTEQERKHTLFNLPLCIVYCEGEWDGPSSELEKVAAFIIVQPVSPTSFRVRVEQQIPFSAILGAQRPMTVLDSGLASLVRQLCIQLKLGLNAKMALKGAWEERVAIIRAIWNSVNR